MSPEDPTAPPPHPPGPEDEPARAALDPLARAGWEELTGQEVHLADVRYLDPVRTGAGLPAVQAAAMAATGFVAGAAVATVLRHSQRRRQARRRSKRPVERVALLARASYLVDLRLIARE